MPLPIADLVGNLTNDPELLWTKDQTALAKFRVACNERKKDANGEWTDGRATFVDVVAWSRLAEDVAGTLTKGEKVVVKGRIVQSEWTTEAGEKRTRLEVHADTIARPIALGGGAPPDRKSVSRFVDDEEPF